MSKFFMSRHYIFHLKRYNILLWSCSFWATNLINFVSRAWNSTTDITIPIKPLEAKNSIVICITLVSTMASMNSCSSFTSSRVTSSSSETHWKIQRSIGSLEYLIFCQIMTSFFGWVKNHSKWIRQNYLIYKIVDLDFALHMLFDFFFLFDPNVEHFLTWNQASVWR